MVIKTLDGKGRVALGKRFANQTVLVDDSDATRIIITPAVVLPAHEAWLYRNRRAIRSVERGIKQARAGEFATSSPDVDADWIDDLED